MLMTVHAYHITDSTIARARNDMDTLHLTVFSLNLGYRSRRVRPWLTTLREMGHAIKAWLKR